ncbi:flagellar basal body P-ring formation chaperone FlgA [Rhodoferax sp. GW822-FHT02A01]|uniref:flagellar basal body P-ring formation chaperone FlgA n=1 Tax=Rhodoferax sp. GW822-FHT02A01 TaxID=3141537 RepID=UPI00315C5993
MRTLIQIRPQHMRWLLLRGLLVAAAVLLLGKIAHAQSQEPDYAAMALKWARSNVNASLPESATPLRVDMTVGALDSRLRLAPCGNVEAYLPPGSRLWGHTRVGVRCVDGVSRWNVSVPLTVKVFGNAWVVRGQVMAGAALAQSDLVQTEVDWAEDSSPVLIDAALWLGQTATRQLMTGQVLRQGMVRPTQVFQAGTQVRVVAEGAGFQISSDAQALSAGVVGQTARVRMDNGRVTSGTVLDARTVKIEL